MSDKKNNSWLKQLNRTPPWFCRLVARKARGHKPMSNSDIAAVSGLARSTIDKLGHMRDWNKVTAATIQKFSLACGVNLLKPHEAVNYFRDSGLWHVKIATREQKAMYDRLLSQKW